MGKKNRSKNKRLKNLQSHKISQVSQDLENLFVLRTFQDYKEDFIVKTKQITSKLLGEFEEFSAIRLQSKVNIQLRFKRTGIFNFSNEFTYKDDPSSEVLEIFLKIFNKFADDLVENLKDIAWEQPEKCAVVMQDAFQVIETFTSDLNAVAAAVFGLSESVFKNLCLSIFREKLKKNRVLDKVFERIDGKNPDGVAEVLSNLKRGMGELDKKDLEMDLVVENFQRTLDLNVQCGLRSKPYFTESWIEKIKKSLRNARDNLGYC